MFSLWNFYLVPWYSTHLIFTSKMLQFTSSNPDTISLRASSLSFCCDNLLVFLPTLFRLHFLCGFLIHRTHSLFYLSLRPGDSFHALRGFQRDVVYLDSWLTNWALLYEPKCWGGGGFAGFHPMSTVVHRSPNKLCISNSIFNLCSYPSLHSLDGSAGVAQPLRQPGKQTR